MPSSGAFRPEAAYCNTRATAGVCAILFRGGLVLAVVGAVTVGRVMRPAYASTDGHGRTDGTTLAASRRPARRRRQCNGYMKYPMPTPAAAPRDRTSASYRPGVNTWASHPGTPPFRRGRMAYTMATPQAIVVTPAPKRTKIRIMCLAIGIPLNAAL